jgi:hypothetical protein
LLNYFFELCRIYILFLPAISHPQFFPPFRNPHSSRHFATPILPAISQPQFFPPFHNPHSSCHFATPILPAMTVSKAKVARTTKNKKHNSHTYTYTKIVQIPTTMAAAAAPHEYLPMELRPP